MNLTTQLTAVSRVNQIRVIITDDESNDPMDLSTCIPLCSVYCVHSLNAVPTLLCQSKREAEVLCQSKRAARGYGVGM